MLGNYLKIAYRNLKRYRGYSLINVSGLAIGIACCLLILLYVRYELSYDRHWDKADRIYRVAYEKRFSDETVRIAISPVPLADALLSDHPEVLEATRLVQGGNKLIAYERNRFYENRFLFADARFFKVFPVRFIQGNPETALEKPHSIVLTEAAARKYFGYEDPIGKSIRIENKDAYRITGVVENVPQNSHFHFDFLASLASLPLIDSRSWLNKNIYTYILLREDYSPALLERKFPDLIEKHIGPQYRDSLGISLKDFLVQGNGLAFFLQPLTEIHLHSDLGYELEANSDVRYLYVFSAIALSILFIACINFMNLATAKYTNRTREIGLRKVFGSNKAQLVRQFLTESVLLSSVSLFLALSFIELSLPVFNDFTGKEMVIGFFDNTYVLPVLIGVVLLVGILAGSYPAFFLSSFQPIDALRERTGAGGKNSRVRNWLVVLQFTTTIALFLCTFVIYNQLEYFQNKKLGFDQEQVVVLPRAYVLGGRLDAFKRALLKHSDITGVSNTKDLPGSSLSINEYHLEGDGSADSCHLYVYGADTDLVETFNLEMATGRYFSRERDPSADLHSVVINETALREFSWSDPIGKRLFFFDPVRDQRQYFTIVGLVKDFHFDSLYQKIKPMAIFLSQNREFRYVNVKIDPDRASHTLAFLEKEWRRFAPGRPFEYFFLDDHFNGQYQSEQETGQLFVVFSVLAIVIACLGLFGLVSFTTEQRTKEIGVRKALGASLSSIILLLSKDVVKLIAIASVIAWPFAYYAMNRWLQSFAYHIEIDFLPFIFTSLLVLTIALTTVGLQVVKTALKNPADSLQYE
ncbi:MAG: FtsX-like permease family protein [Proteobacteria bacterium]|nr:FtsX-like permease family protein [Pseudomonadota bacterium]